MNTTTADYVVVGSGAGGGPLAVRLAKAGHSVVVLEAGDYYDGPEYDVPAFHPYATENERIRWDFFVRRYDDKRMQERDPKYSADRDGVWYPRAGTLGGCTAHNAMITVCPPDTDWDEIANWCEDPTWSAQNMRRYFKRIEKCGYRWRPPACFGTPRIADSIARARRVARWAPWLGRGFDGWLPTSLADPALVLTDPQLRNLIGVVIESQMGAKYRHLWRWLVRFPWISTDLNDVHARRGSTLGVWRIPVSIEKGRRRGPREPLLEAAQASRGQLRILTNCLATKLVLDGNQRCRGVEYLRGAHLYRADPLAGSLCGGCPGTVHATCEVIVSAGAFNTPQLLKLSGIGPREELECRGIAVQVALPGVGANLQDRYEVSVITETYGHLKVRRGGVFRPPRPGDAPDRLLSKWRKGKGAYTANGSIVGVVVKSQPELDAPDLFLMAVPAGFNGYLPGYSEELPLHPNRLTWIILKAYTQNRSGEVLLRTADPRDVPDIRFRYFENGGETDGKDLDAMIAGINLVRTWTDSWTAGVREIVPGRRYDSKESLKAFVLANAWGHHACGTCAIGPDGDVSAVLDSQFRVRGVHGLRVVDASVFPRIPGYFIAAAIYMISEKAADVILNSHPHGRIAE